MNYDFLDPIGAFFTLAINSPLMVLLFMSFAISAIIVFVTRGLYRR